MRTTRARRTVSGITRGRRARLAVSDDVDVEISLDGAAPEVGHDVRGAGSYAMVARALENLAEAGLQDAKISVVVTATTSTNSTTSPIAEPLRGDPALTPARPRAGAPTCGTSSTRPPPSKWSSTTGWLRRARAC